MEKERKREKICEAASRLFVKKGFEKTTIRDIALEANINSSAIYYYFENKEFLLYRILMEIMDSSLEKMRAISEGSLSPEAKISEVIQLHTWVYGINPDTMELIVYNMKSLDQEHHEEIRKKQSQYAKVVVRILDELKKRGEMIDLDTTVCTFSLFGMIQWAHRWYNPEGAIKPDQLCKIFTQIFIRGIYSDRR